MHANSRLQERLHELRERKDALRVIQKQVQTHQPTHAPPQPHQAHTSHIAQAHKVHLQPTATVNIPPAPLPNKPARKQRAPRIADVIGRVGVTPSITTLPTDDTSTSSALPTAPAQGTPLTYQTGLHDDASATRATTAMRMHAKLETILLTAHASRSDAALSAPAGVVNVWAVERGPSALQRTLVAPAALTTLETFAISPMLVLAGTAVGSILMWDLRANSALPMSALTAFATDVSDCHGRRAVTSLRTTPTTSPFFLTTSASGHVCKWTLTQPDRPVTQAFIREANVSDRVSVSRCDLPASTVLSGEVRKLAHRPPSLFTGSLQGGVHRVEAAERAWTLPQERGRHAGGVTAVRAHPAGMRTGGLDDIVATAGRDWKTCVWQMRRGHNCKNVWSYDNVCNGVVSDLAWSGVHSTVLAAGDESGVLSVFDVSGHLLHPVSAAPVWSFSPPGDGASGGGGCAGISAVQWGWNDRCVCTGDDMGNVRIWATTSSLASLPDADWLSQFFKSKAARIEGT